MKKILVVSVSVGHGHTRAAAALKKAADLFYPQTTIEHVDFLNFIGNSSNKIFFDTYDLMVKNTPSLYRILYDISDNKIGSKILENITALNTKLNIKKFKEYVLNYSPDAIIFTHFIPVGVFNIFNNAIPSFTVITDYNNHCLWFTSNRQKYFVANVEVKNQLIALGADQNNIVISGIPVDPDFYQVMDDEQKKMIKEKLNIADHKKIIVVMPAGKGNIDPVSLINKILQEKDVVVLALSGHDKNLLEKYKKINNENIKVIDWTDKIYEYLQLADLVITKPGGLTISECLAANKPMIFINPIPGQEEKNFKYITSIGLGAVLESEDLWTKIWQDIKHTGLPVKPTVDQAANIIIDNILKTI